MPKTPFTRGTSVIASDHVRHQVSDLVGEKGERRATMMLGVSREIPARIIAGMPITPGCAQTVLAALEKLGRL